GGGGEANGEVATVDRARAGDEVLHRAGDSGGDAERDGDRAEGDEDEQHVDRRREIVHLRLDLPALHDERERERVIAARSEVDRTVNLDVLRGAGHARRADDLLSAQDDVEIRVAGKTLRLD